MNEHGCKYWTGIINDKCEFGIKWREELKNARTCIGKDDGIKCNNFTLRTPEEIKEEQNKIDKAVAKSVKMLKTKKSDCCNAPIDESRVIKKGRHKGHGGRYCSKCKRCLYWV